MGKSNRLDQKMTSKLPPTATVVAGEEDEEEEEDDLFITATASTASTTSAATTDENVQQTFLDTEDTSEKPIENDEKSENNAIDDHQHVKPRSTLERIIVDRNKQY